MSNRLRILGLVVVLGGALSTPLRAAQAVQGSVGNVQSLDGATMGSAGCRVWSLSDPGINNNQSATNPVCVNNRCPRNYSPNSLLQPGGYICQGENTAAYANDLDQQTFYQLIDTEANGLACDHTAFYSVQGLLALSSGNPSGDFRTSGCPGLSVVNCFERADGTDARTTPLNNTHTGYGGNPHSIPSVGGLSPVPVVRVSFPGSGCAAGQARLTWDEPELYVNTMKGGVQSPVKGVRLYSNSNGCGFCPDGENGWVAGAAFPRGAGATGVCVPITAPTWFALTVRLTGPGGGANEVETGRVGGSGFVGANSQCVSPGGTAVRIANISARYVGRGSVNVNFTTGLEGGVQSYYVTRSTSPLGPFERVSEALAPRGDSSTYAFTDKVRTALGRNVYYSVEVVGTDGVSQRSATASVTLPAAKRKLTAN